MREKAIVLWSGGKDCALALHDVLHAYEIVALLTTVTGGDDRISMHGVQISLLEKQAASFGYPLEIVVVPRSCSNNEYELKMRAALDRYRQSGVTSVICGDLFLEDVRRYREERFFSDGLKGVFPLWNQPTQELASRFLSLGFQSILCCVDTTAVDQQFTGRLFDRDLLADLPQGVDPCGENGEFHTFVFDGPGFVNRIDFKIGERSLRDNRFSCCDLVDG